ncbi:DeoR/GlpR family DNA-binding transcription regulator [Buttiauxella selenatireducens]|uniref:DeoR/GlpR family DNA-binding transcription regulator n=1 Tax=Buttiauxella selenatireducens TaxID=3073902 RepID=A0ABY9SCK7_9ENTR|nr:DeoR/GlpR family DNA-binding transcription regulator [Buttiauxella sp. R73]WMY73867.1 DeoR/GlpR family DNA-binding transcription regulator [Buttiauxella sp. R73]
MAKPSTSLLKRRLDIAEIVRKNGEIKVDDLAEMLAVSGVTIRNDLNYLEQQGYLKRSFGGAIYTAQPVGIPVSYDVPCVQPLDNAIELELAKQVARQAGNEETVFLGAGSVLRKAIPFLGEYRELCLVVNDLAHVAPARDYIDGEMVLLGGVLGSCGQTLEGELALQSLRQYQPSRCLVMVESISDDGTLNVASEAAAAILQEAIKASTHCVVAIARRPVYGEARYAVGKLSQVSAVVTPQMVAAEYHSRFLAVGLSNSYTNNECLTWINPALHPAR